MRIQRSPFKPRAKAGYKIENKTTEEATVYIYSMIGGWFGIDHEEWIKEFNSIDASTIHLRIDSDGGDVFAARAIKTAIMQHKAKVIAHIDGLAASSASFIVMGADEIEIVDGGFLMVHKALSIIDILGLFNEDDLKEVIGDLKEEVSLHGKINQAIATDYAKKSGKTLADAAAWMGNKGTWFTAKEALDAGLVDRIYDGTPVEENYDLSIYDNVPEELKVRIQTSQSRKDSKKDPNERDAEKALREAGFSRNQAKEILAKGFQNERDAQTELVDKDVREAQTIVTPPLRDAEQPPKKKDRTAELLTRGEILAPTQYET